MSSVIDALACPTIRWIAFTLAAASGGTVLGVEVEARPVLYMALEDDPRRLQLRSRILLDDEPRPSGFSFMTRYDGEGAMDVARSWVESHGDDKPLVIVNTLEKIRGGRTQSAYSDDYKAGTLLQKYLFTGDTMVLGDSGAWWAGYIAGISDADALAASLRLLRTLSPDVVISSAYQGDSAVTRIDAGRWPEHVDQALEGLTTAVAQPRTRYIQIASRNQFGSLRYRTASRAVPSVKPSVNSMALSA